MLYWSGGLLLDVVIRERASILKLFASKYEMLLIIKIYCSISFNLAGPVMHYRPAKILVSALSEFGCDKARNLAVQCRRPQNFTMLRL
jgi:hypothetical protein